MKFDTRTTELIALGASIAANCQSCLEHHVAKASECGIDPADIAEAIDIGKTVRAGAAASADKAAEDRPHGRPSTDASGPADTCSRGPWRMSGCCPK